MYDPGKLRRKKKKQPPSFGGRLRARNAVIVVMFCGVLFFVVAWLRETHSTPREVAIGSERPQSSDKREGAGGKEEEREKGRGEERERGKHRDERNVPSPVANMPSPPLQQMGEDRTHHAPRDEDHHAEHDEYAEDTVMGDLPQQPVEATRPSPPAPLPSTGRGEKCAPGPSPPFDQYCSRARGESPPAAIPGSHEAKVAENPRAKRQPPAAAAQEEAGRLIDDIYKTAAAKTPEQKLALAKELLKLAKSPGVKPEERFVVLQKASELAVEGGDVPSAWPPSALPAANSSSTRSGRTEGPGPGREAADGSRRGQGIFRWRERGHRRGGRRRAE